MATISKLFIALCISILTGFSALAQPVKIVINVIPPITNDLTAYIENPNKILIQVINTSAESHDIKFHVSLTSDNGVTVNTKEFYTPKQAYKILPFESKLLDPAEIMNYGNESDFEYSGISIDNLIRTRMLPEGNYTLCLEAYDFNSPGLTVPLSMDYPSGCIHNIQLVTLDPPQIMSVGMNECGSTLAPAVPQLVNIMWLPPAGLFKMIQYNVQMVEVVPANRDINDAIFTNAGPLFLDEWVQSTVFTINSTHQQLKVGAKYAFRVRAVDPDNMTSFRNDGYSQVCSFSWGTEEYFPNANFSQNIIFPQSNDTLPFINVPMLAPWLPFDNYLSRMTTQVSLSDNGMLVGNRVNSFSFSPDVLTYVADKCNSQQVPLEEIQMYLSPTAPSFFSGANLTKGRDYDIDLNSIFQIRNNPIEQTLVSTGAYHYGMPFPRTIAPENNAVVEPGTRVFSIRTGSLNRPFLNGRLSALSNAKQVYDYTTPIKVDETLVFELSESTDFASAYNRQLIRMNYEMTLEDINVLYDSVFKPIEITVPDLPEGVYYWRIKYLSQPNNSSVNAPAYRIGATQKLVVGGSSNTPTEPCLASDCNAAEVSQRVAVATLNIGSWLKMGEFDLLVSSITQSQNSSFSGEGIVLINPFPTGNSISGFYPVKVAFENLRFNNLNQVFEGSATTISSGQNPWNIVSGSVYPQGNDIIALQNLCANAPAITVPPLSADASYYTQNGTNTPFIIPVLKNGLIQYDFSILGIKFTPLNAKINCAITTTGIEENQTYTFMAADLCLKSTGWASEVVEMNLLNDINISFLGSTIKIEGFKNNQAYSKAVWDCSGFRHLKLLGNVQFSRSLIRPSNSNYNAPNSFVTGFYETEAISLDNVMYQVAIQEPYHFVATGKSLTVDSPVVFIDRSESINPNGLVAPPGYNGGISNDWNGVFFPQMDVYFEVFGNQTIRANNFFYDGQVTGQISGTNIFDINQHVIGNMNISLDTVDINLVQDNFMRYHFAGRINPGLNETFMLNYLMDCDMPDVNGQSNMHGRVLMGENLTVPLDFMYSTFSVSRNSTLIFDKVAGDVFRPVLTLNGKMTLQGEFDHIGMVDLPEMHVEQMKLRSNPRVGEKYFTSGTISFSSPQKYVGGFPITITEVSDIVNGSSPGEFGLNFIYQLGLGSTTENFNISGNLGIRAKSEMIDQKVRYSFKSATFDSLSVSGSISVANFNGKLYFFKNDPVYGNGLIGDVNATFEPGVSLLSKAYFGKIKVGQSTHNYWGVFGGVRFAEAVPVLGLIECRAFAGGVFYNMRQEGSSGNVNVRRVQEPNSGNIAVSLVPQVNTSGFAAKVWLQSSGGGDSFKSLSTIGAEFNSNSWSLNRLFLEGNMWIMPENNVDVPVWADLNIDLDWRTRTLSGNFNAYVQHASLEGIGNNYRAGYINLLIAPNKWHLYVGAPSDRIGVRVPGLGAELNAYLCVGSEVPGVPPLPQRIRDVLSGTTIGNFRDQNVATGKGFAFGAFFNFNPPPSTFLIFKGDLDLMLGFDLSLIKYTGDVSCDGINILPNFGLNKWYAQGQLYAYVYASLGIYVDVWFAEGSFNIFRGEAGVALAAGLPNPTWATGALAGNYKILGGAIKGRFTYEFSLGSVCRPTEIAPNPVANLKIIEDVNIVNNSNNISPFVSFSAALNFKPNHVFNIELIDENGNDYVRTFRAKVSPQMKRGTSTIAISNEVIDDSAGEDVYYRMDIQPVAALAASSSYQLILAAHFEERKNARWAVAKNNRGEEVRQNMIRNFTTGRLPDKIPASVVSKSVPMSFENYFKVLAKYGSSGPVSQKQFEMQFTHDLRESYFYDSANHVLPDLIHGGTYVGRIPVAYKLRITNLENNEKQDYNLQILSNRIRFSQNLSQILAPNIKYKIEVIRKKILPLDFINNQINFGNQVNLNYTNVGNNSSYSVQKRNLTFQSNGANIIDDVNDVEFRLYEFYFKTSKFTSMYDKVAQMTLTGNQRDASYKVLKLKFNSQERFSNLEMVNELKFIDIYQGEKQFFDNSDRQYEVYEMLKQKAAGTPFAPWIASPEPFSIKTSPSLVPGSKNHYAYPSSTVNFTTKESFLNQISEPSNNQIIFVSPYEQFLSIDRPKIQNYCASYLTLLANISPEISYYNQVNLSGNQRVAVGNIISTSWTKRMGLYFENTYVPDPNQYNMRFLMLKPDGTTGAIRNIFYRLN